MKFSLLVMAAMCLSACSSGGSDSSKESTAMVCEAEAGVASRQHTSIKAQMLDRFAVTADQFQGLDADGDVALDEVLGDFAVRSLGFHPFRHHRLV